MICMEANYLAKTCLLSFLSRNFGDLYFGDLELVIVTHHFFQYIFPIEHLSTDQILQAVPHSSWIHFLPSRLPPMSGSCTEQSCSLQRMLLAGLMCSTTNSSLCCSCTWFTWCKNHPYLWINLVFWVEKQVKYSKYSLGDQLKERIHKGGKPLKKKHQLCHCLFWKK